MQNVLSISQWIIPIMVIGVVGYGYFHKINVYDCFIEGVKEGVKITIDIFPYVLGMFLAINIFINSGFLNTVLGYFNPVLDMFNINSQIIALALLRPLSGSASLSMLDSILKLYGPDSFYGRVASTIQGSTDTTLYIITLYFGSIGVKKIRYTLIVCLLADVFGVVVAILMCNILF